MLPVGISMPRPCSVSACVVIRRLSPIEENPEYSNIHSDINAKRMVLVIVNHRIPISSSESNSGTWYATKRNRK